MKMSVYNFCGLRFNLSVTALLISFELVISQLVHGVFKHILPNIEILLHPLIILVILLIASSALKLSDIVKIDRIILTALLALAIPSVFHILLGSAENFNFLILGIGPLLLGIILIQSKEASMIIKMLIIGALLWCIVVMIVWGIDLARFLNASEWANQYSFDKLIIVMRAPGSVDPSPFYPHIVGNWNKTSNYIVLMSLLVISAANRRYVSLMLAGTTLAALSIVQILSFSRGGMLVASCIGIIILALAIKKALSEKYFLMFGSFMLALPLLVTALAPATRLAWLSLSSNQQRLILADKGAAKIIDRIIQLMDQGKIFELLFGSGVGSYGRNTFGNKFAETHNMFIDILLAGGIIEFFGVITLFLYAWHLVLRKNRDSTMAQISALAIFAVVVLSFREFSLNYLGVISLPSLLIGIFIGQILQDTQGQKTYL